MWRLSRYDIPTGEVITTPGDIKGIHNINGEIWVDTEYNISSIDKDTLYIKEDKNDWKGNQKQV
ncbi:MAG: hypothetical protein R2883_00615 [Caldisericia bacterium]